LPGRYFKKKKKRIAPGPLAPQFRTDKGRISGQGNRKITNMALRGVRDKGIFEHKNKAMIQPKLNWASNLKILIEDQEVFFFFFFF